MRQLNMKFLLILSTTLLVLGAGMHFVHGYQLKRNAGGFLTQATRAEESGDLALAIEHLGRYLGLVPADHDALARYGLLLAKTAQSPKAKFNAFYVLERALREDGGREDVRRRLIHLAIELERYSDAIDHLTILRQARPDDGEVDLLLGQCQESSGHFQEAGGSYEKAVLHAPHQVEGYVRLARVLDGRLNQSKKADEKLAALVAANPQAFQAYLERARYYRERSAAREGEAGKQPLEQAAQDIAQAGRLAPEDVDVLLESAEVAQAQGKVEDARAALARACELHAKNVRVYQALSMLEVRADRRAEALASLRQGMQAVPEKAVVEQSTLRWMLADLLVGGNPDEVAEAEKIVADLRKRDANPALVNYVQGRAELARKEWAGSIRTLEQDLPELTRFPELVERANVALGRGYEQLGNPDQAYLAYRRAVAANPLSVPGSLGLAAMQTALGKWDDALETYRIVLPRVPGARMLMARVLLRRTLDLPPARRSWTQLEQLLDEADRMSPDAVDIALLRADVLVARGQPGALEQAREVLTAARDKHPKQAATWAALVTLAQRQQQWDEALRLLGEAERQLGKTVELRRARVNVELARGGAEARKTLAQMTPELERLPDTERQALLATLADAYVRLAEPAEAQKLFRRLAQEQPHNLRLQQALFDLALQDNNAEAMGQAVREMQRIEGDRGTLWRYAQACQCIAQARKQKDEAKELLAKAGALLAVVAAQRGGWANVWVCEGEIQDLSGNVDAAIAKYQKAIELGDQSPNLVHRVVQLLYQRRRYLEADQTIQRLQSQGPLLGSLDRLAADVAFQEHDYGRALKLAQKAMPADSKDYRDHLWRGQVLAAAGQQAEAEAALRRAVALAEQTPDPWVALLQHQLATGQKDKAAATLKEAEAKLPRDQAALALAQCHELVGDLDGAKQLYEAALAQKPDDLAILRNLALFYLKKNQPRETEKYLEKVLKLKNQAPEDVAWARRLLGILLAGSGYQQSRYALELLGVNAAAPGKDDSPEDLRAKAVVLAMQKSHQEKRQAIILLEALQQRKAAGTADLFLLAQLYEAFGDWSKARDLLVRVVAAEERPEYLAQYAQSLLRHNQADEARVWLARLEKREPNAFRTVALKAQLLKGEDRAAEAVPLIKALAEAKDAQLVPLAQLLEGIGQAGAAEELYRKDAATAKRPEAVLVLAQFLARQHRLPEALQLCEQAWQSCPAEAVAQSFVVVLTDGKATEQECQTVARRMESVVQKQPDRVELVSQLAAVYCLQNRHDKAITLYRQVLERDPNAVLALNNLAWMLALKEGKQGDALPLIQRAIDTFGPEPWLLDTRGIVQLSLGQQALAVRDFQEANAMAPNAAQYLHLARACQLANNPAAAAEAFQRAKDLGLQEGQLDPLERPIYHLVRAGLERM